MRFIFPFLVLLFLSCEENKDENSPAVSITSPVSGSYYPAGESVEISVIPDLDQDDAVTLYFFYDAVMFAEISSSPYTATLPNVNHGDNNLIVQAVFSPSSLFRADTIQITGLAAPFVNFVNLGTNYNHGDTISVEVIAASPNGPIEYISMELDNLFFTSDSSSPYLFNVPLDNLGDLRITATAYDSLEVPGSRTRVIAVIQNAAPNISFVNSGPRLQRMWLGESRRLAYSATDGQGSVQQVDVYANDSLIHRSTQADGYLYFTPDSMGEYRISSLARDDMGVWSEADTIHFTVEPAISFNQTKLSDISFSNVDSIMFGINVYSNTLLSMNIEAATVSKTITLPASSPIAMQYSNQDEKIYIVYENSGDISVFDLDTEFIENYEYSSSNHGRDIEIDHVNRRIYVLTDKGAYILNQDDGSLLHEDLSVEGSSIEFDAAGRKLFACSDAMTRYDVANDDFSVEESVSDYIQSPGKLAIHPLGHILSIPDEQGNGAGYAVAAIDAANMTNLFGSWDIGTSPNFVHFGRTTDHLFGTNGSFADQYMYVMNVSTYEQVDSWSAPNSSDYSIIETNLNETRAVLFSYQSYDDIEFRLYIYDLTALE